MPVRDPGSLYFVSYRGFDSRTGRPQTWASNSYLLFRQMRAALTGQAKVVAVSFASRIDLTFSSDASMEKAYRQEVSGEMFPDFGLHPALGRLLSEEDDRIPGAKPLAVLSYDYWTARFGRDPAVIGRTFHMGNVVYQIVGVAPKGFIGTEPGTMTDIFAPTMEAASVNRDNSLLLAAIGLYGVGGRSADGKHSVAGDHPRNGNGDGGSVSRARYCFGFGPLCLSSAISSQS